MNTRQRFTALLLCLLFTVLSLSSCTRQEKKYTAYAFTYFDTAISVTGCAADQAEFDRISGEILAMLGEYHRLYTIYERYDGMENLCTINDLENGVHRTVTADRRIIEMLLYAKEMHRLTNGRINIAMGSVLSLWHSFRTAASEDPTAAALPSAQQLREAAEHTDIDKLIINADASTVWLADPAMTLDVGAIAKGYAVEMTARAFEKQGITGYVINAGGNVRTIGTKPSGAKWIVGIENPREDEAAEPLAYLYLAGESLVTSGSYQRYYTVNGINYHHIIDPQTLMPAEGYLSVSVVCGNSAQGDALSTALFCMPIEEGMALVDSLPDTEALWILADGSRRESDGFAAYTDEQ